MSPSQIQLSSTHRITYQYNRVCFMTKINYLLLIKLNIKIQPCFIILLQQKYCIWCVLWIYFKMVICWRGEIPDLRPQALEGLNPGEDGGYYNKWPPGIVLISVFVFVVILSANTLPGAACPVWASASLWQLLFPEAWARVSRPGSSRLLLLLPWGPRCLCGCPPPCHWADEQA